MQQTSKTTINYIIDCSSITSIYSNNYFQIKEIVNLYIVYLLARTVNEHKANNNDVFLYSINMEVDQYNILFKQLIHGTIAENEYINKYINENIAVLPSIVLRLLDVIFESLVNGITHIVELIKYNPNYLNGQRVYVDTFFLNQHTLIVAFKTL